MIFLKKTIKESEVPIFLMKLNYSGKKRLAVNFGLRIDIYSYSYKLIDTISLDCFVYQMCSVKLSDENVLFLISKFEYLVFSGKKLLFRNQFETLIGCNSIPNKIYTHSNSLIVFYNCGRWRLFTLNKEKTLEKSSNDQLFENNLLSVQYFNKKIFLSLKDYEDNVCLLQLQIKGSTNEAIFTNVNNLPKNTKNIILLDDFIVVFFENKLSLYVKEELIYETNFANCELNCFLQVENILLLFMKDGEVIQLRINNKISIENIKKLKSPVKQILKLKEKYFAITAIGWFFFIFNEEIKIIAQSKDMSLDKFAGDLIFLSKTNQISKLITTKKLKLKNKIKLRQKIDRFWFFNGKLIVSFDEKSEILDIKKNVILKTLEKIENFKIISSVEAIFCSKLIIYKYFQNNIFELKIDEKILLSSFYNKMGLIYTGKNLVILENFKIIKKIVCNEDLTTIFIEDFIFLSNVENECFFYDLKFKLQCKFTFKSFLNVFSNENEIFFVDHLKILYCISKKSLNLNSKIKAMPNLFLKLCKCPFDTKNFLLYENNLIFTSKNPQLLNLQTKNIYLLNIKNITNGFIYKKQIIFSKGPKLYFYFNTFLKEITYKNLPFKKVEKILHLNDKKIILYSKKLLKYFIDEKEIYVLKLKYKLIELVQCCNLIVCFFIVKSKLLVKFFSVKNGISETKNISLEFKEDSFKCQNNIFMFYNAQSVLIYKIIKNNISLIAKLRNLPSLVNPVIDFNRKNIFIHSFFTNFIYDFQGNKKEMFEINHKISNIAYNKYIYQTHKELLLVFNSKFKVKAFLFDENCISDISTSKSKGSNYVYYLANNEVKVLANNLVDKREEDFLIKLNSQINTQYKIWAITGNFLNVNVILKYWQNLGEEDSFVLDLYRKLDDLS